MKASLFAFSAAALLAAAVPARAQTPFVETSTLTLFWSFTESYQSNIFTDVPSLPDVATFDPETLPNGVAKWVDTLRVQPYTGPVAGTFAPAGSNTQFINLLLQRLVRNRTISKNVLGYRWQLIAVREAPATVAELATNPYRIFLAGQFSNSSLASPVVEVAPSGPETISDDPLVLGVTSSLVPSEGSNISVDTGITLSLGGFTGNYVERNWLAVNGGSERVRNVTGSVATAFRLDLGALFYEDPKHNVTTPSTNPFNYHLNRNIWRASASGVINYGLRTVPSPEGTGLPSTILATSVSGTGTGWFSHQRNQVVYENNVPVYTDSPTQNYASVGTAPLRVVLSNVQYQKRDRFRLAPTTITPNFTAVNSVANRSVQLVWDNPGNETYYVLERMKEASGIWEVIPPPDANATSFVDRGLSPDSFYSYRMKAGNGGGISDYSNIITASTVAAPDDLQAKAGTGVVNLTWNDNSRIETGYEIQRRISTGTTWSTITIPPLPANTTSYADTSGTAGTSYVYRVRAVDPIGFSAFSNTSP